MTGLQAAILGGSALILLVLALRLGLQRHLPRRLFPALWCAAAVRLLLPRAEGQRADGRNQNLGKKEGEDHADHKAEAKRAQDDRKELSCERVNCGAAV